MNRHTAANLTFLSAILLGSIALAAPTSLPNRDLESGTWQAKSRAAQGGLGDPTPLAARQGGDNWETATPIETLPAVVTGTTCGYDYCCGGYCGGWESLGPDVVYSYVATADTAITIDACGSSFDTMVFVWDEWQNMVACNDDRWGPSSDCGQYTSRIDRVPVEAGALYYIVMAGYSGCGDYVMTIEQYAPCELDCVGILEGEPELHDGYFDAYNGGCANGAVFQPLAGDANGHLVLCGKSGWYQSGGTDRFDLDWFLVTLGPGGTLEWSIDSEEWTMGYVISPTDCSDYQIVDTIESGSCGSDDTIYTGQPGDAVWLVVRPGQEGSPQHFVGHEYNYVCTISGLDASVAVEHWTWSSVKGLFGSARED